MVRWKCREEFLTGIAQISRIRKPGEEEGLEQRLDRLIRLDAGLRKSFQHGVRGGYGGVWEGFTVMAQSFTELEKGLGTGISRIERWGKKSRNKDGIDLVD